MFIIEMTRYESDFVNKNTKNTRAYNIRTFDIDHEMSLFIYYYDDYVQLKLKRYGDKQTRIEDWYQLAEVGVLYPDLDLNKMTSLNIKDNQVQAILSKVSIDERNDY